MEPIAVIGIGCRFPGAPNPEAFWRLLRDGGDAVTEVPSDRWNPDDFYDPNLAAPGKMNTRWGGFLDQVDQFDPSFFKISPREAAYMDPQQRLLLEVAWEALEDAGQAVDGLAGSKTGVFVGIGITDYGQLQLRDANRIDTYTNTGSAFSIAANRISYVFDFRGPSVAVDTACSSSLVAVHLACQSILNGESEVALAGGVNLLLSPMTSIGFSKLGTMSPDGRCKAFDARANGYVRGEGAGVVVLKPLARALADGDPVYAVIRGSAVNQDGRSNGLTAPNRWSQEAVLREAYRRAGVSPGQVQYVEAHGTGTLLGDPIEAKALGAVLAENRPAGRRCAVGSVKSNFGHLETAAGIAGLIKVVLSLKNGAIPPSLHFEKPNPHIPFEQLSLQVQQGRGAWADDCGPAVAGVSSFGFGGTNAHVVLEQTRAEAAAQPPPAPATTECAQLLPLSAHTPEALQALALSYKEFIAAGGAGSEASLQDVCYTAGMRRSQHDQRLALVFDTREELAERLESFLQGDSMHGIAAGRKHPSRRSKVVFVFPGQGSQWLGMGRELMEQEPAFRAALERCEQAIRPHVDWSLLEQLTAGEGQSRLNEIDVIQPAIFAIQVALAALWRSWGVEPDAVVGHSMGEVAAAQVAGALSLEDAAQVICRRSRLLKRVSGKGAMAVVELPLEEAQLALAGYEDRLSIAVSNGPTSTVLSGDPRALAELLEVLQGREVFCRQIKVDVASHSPQMDPLRAELLQALEGLRPGPASVPIYSTVTSEFTDGREFDAAYWVRNLREPVLFSAAIQHLLGSGHDAFVEVSPHPILTNAVKQALLHAGHEGTVLPSLRREEKERAVMLESLGALYCIGCAQDLSRLYSSQGRYVRLPSYPWQRKRCWLEVEAQPAAGGGASRPPGEGPLSGRQLSLAHPEGDLFWETEIHRGLFAYLDEGEAEGPLALPNVAQMEVALTAAEEVFGAAPHVLTEIEFRRALSVPRSGSQKVQVVLSAASKRETSFHVYSRPGGEGRLPEAWTLHATGKIRHEQEHA